MGPMSPAESAGMVLMVIAIVGTVIVWIYLQFMLRNENKDKERTMRTLSTPADLTDQMYPPAIAKIIHDRAARINEIRDLEAAFEKSGIRVEAAMAAMEARHRELEKQEAEIITAFEAGQAAARKPKYKLQDLMAEMSADFAELAPAEAEGDELDVTDCDFKSGLDRIQENRGMPLRKREVDILKSCPLLFRSLCDPDPYRSVVAHWGLEVGDGWLDIVGEACSKIEELISLDIQFFDIWKHLHMLEQRTLDYHDHYENPLLPEPAPLFLFCAQIKEKLGGLNIYVTPGITTTDETMAQIRQIIEEASQRAAHTCENCGAPGILIQEGCWRVRCPTCEAERTD